MRRWVVAACLLITFDAWHSWSQRPVHRPDGVIPPMDLAVGRGRMSDSATLRDIDLEQQDRY